MSAAGDQIAPVFGALFEGEELPEDGHVRPADRPGFGMTLKQDAVALLRPFARSQTALIRVRTLAPLFWAAGREFRNGRLEVVAQSLDQGCGK